MPNLNHELLAAALVGLEAKRQKLEAQIAEVRSQLGGKVRQTAEVKRGPGRPKGKRTMSAAARKRIADAQKKRWAAYKKSAEAKPTPKPVKKAAAVKKTAVAKKAAPAPKPKRKLSKEARAKLVENLAKARAARAAKKTAGGAVPF